MKEEKEMNNLLTLGELYISDFVKGDYRDGVKHELALIMERETCAVRLKTTAPLSKMFGRYFYRSGINYTMRNELRKLVKSVLELIQLNDEDIFCDIASNDGTLLSFVPENLIRIGIDPAEDSFRIQAEKHSNLIIQDFFSADVFNKSKFGGRKIKVITAVAMLYDVEDIDKFLKDIYSVLDDNGLFVVQLSHSGLMIKQNAFDNILSEHVWYFTLISLKPYLERNGFKIVDCVLNDVNGGSFRVYIRKDLAKEDITPNRDVCEYRIKSLLEYEHKLQLHNPKTWIKWFEQIQALKFQAMCFITKVKAEGKTIWAYGASTKGNTLLQYFGLDNTMIDAIAERNPHKYGLRTIGSNIPIKSEEEMREAQPDYLLILPWHFKKEFIEREKEYLQKGGKMIFPCPSFESYHMKTLNETGVECKTDKSTITHCYLDNYENHIGTWRDKEFTMLEIGVAAGNSIKMWREYFPKAKVYGIDNNPNCAGEGIFIGDHNNPEFMMEVMGAIGRCDLIIDDGSHVGWDMKKLFELLFVGWVEKGGLYCVEDTHCLYSEHYNQGSDAFQFFTGLVRDVDVAGRAMTGNQDYAINHSMPNPPVPEYSRYLKAIHFYPSLYIFERK